MRPLSRDEKNNECLGSDSKMEDIFLHFHLAMVRDMYVGEKGEHLQKPEESERSAGSTLGSKDCEGSLDEVPSKCENYGVTSCAFTKQYGITSGEHHMHFISVLCLPRGTVTTVLGRVGERYIQSRILYP